MKLNESLQNEKKTATKKSEKDVKSFEVLSFKGL